MVQRLKPGKIPDNKIGVYDADGNLRGLVGYRATSATATRFHGQFGSKLGIGPDGKRAWLAPKARHDSAPKKDPRLAASLRAAKGSVSK
jgi:hypothetical protein